METTKILVVEDEASLQELLRYNLAKGDYHPLSALSGKEAIEAARRESPSLVLLDLMLPDMDGLDVCKTLKSGSDTATIPIIMVTARGEESDIVRGLEIGADDYITKPFNLPVLFARIAAVLRRHTSPHVSDTATIVDRGGVTLHPGRRRVTFQGEGVELTNTEFRILHLLMRRPGWVFTRRQIVDAVRSEQHAVTERAVDVQIVGLRKKLGAAAKLIETVRGVGYRFRDADDETSE